MNTIRTLTLAAVAAMSLGVGSAMAQSYGHFVPGDAGAAYDVFGPHTPAMRQSVAPHVAVQSGSSDLSPWAGTGANTDSPWYNGGGTGG